MTPVELAHELGFKSIQEVAGLVHKPHTTLYDWGLKNPALLRAVIIGAAELKKQQEDERFRG